MNKAFASLLALSGIAACSPTASDSASDVSTDSSSGTDDWSEVQETTGDIDIDWAENWTETVEVLGEGAVIIRSLESGQSMDLAWAQQSSVACFPGTQNELYDGAHVLFGLQQSSDTFLTIRASPENDVDLSLYTIQQGSNAFLLPPDITSAVACEAAHSGGDGETEEIQLWASQNPYNVVIGVAGSDGMSTGRFLLEITGSD